MTLHLTAQERLDLSRDRNAVEGGEEPSNLARARQQIEMAVREERGHEAKLAHATTALALLELEKIETGAGQVINHFHEDFRTVFGGLNREGASS